MNVRLRLFVILFIAGFAGVLSLLLIDLTALIRTLPVTADTKLQYSPLFIKLISPIQPTVILALAIFVGISLTPKVGLHAPVFEAFARRDRFAPFIKPQIIPALIAGLLGGVIVVGSWVLARPFLPPEFVTRAEALNRLLPFPTRLLYGGITEELILRWGLLTFLVWAIWRSLSNKSTGPRGPHFVAAIIVSSIVFGLGHLPLAVALGSSILTAAGLYVLVANSLFGLIAGYLYWRIGLEAAIMAHMIAHVVIFSASFLVR